MSKKVLVAYASRAGSTEEVARAVGETLAAQGCAVDVRSVKDVSSLDGYSAVVLGSAVRYSAMLGEAVKFVQQNQAALSKLPVAYFTMYLMNQGEDEANRRARAMYFDAVRKLAPAKSEACFLGVGDMAKVALFERMIGKLVKSPEGDFRDWNAIRAWAAGLPAELAI